MKTVAYAHQAKYIEDYAYLKHHALLWAMRTGKTKAIIDNIKLLKDKGLIDTAIIVAPNFVHFQWSDHEIPKHYDLGDDRLLVWDTAKKNTDEWNQEFRQTVLHRGFSWFVMSTSAVASDKSKKCLREIMRCRGERKVFLCVDESHMYRTASSKRSRMLRGLAKRCDYTRILTGTVITNNPLHAWPQFELLKPGCLGFDTYLEFRYKYQHPSMLHFHGRAPKNHADRFINLDDLWQRIEKWSSVVKAEDCVDLPESVHRVVTVELTQFQKECCRKLIDNNTLALDGAEMTVDNALAMLIRLQQMASGTFVNTETSEIKDLVPMEKVPKTIALEKEILGIEGNIVIWAWFKHDIQRLRRYLVRHKLIDARVVAITGGMDNEAKRYAMEALNNSKGKRVILVGQPLAGGTGLKLSGAGTAIWYSHTWDGIIREQANARCVEMGGAPTQIIDIESGSVDRRILESLRSKSKTVDDFISIFEDIENAY